MVNGPSWLQTSDEWPSKLILASNDEPEAEAKPLKSVFRIEVEVSDEKEHKLYEILEKFQFQKVMRVATWIMRFAGSCRSKKKE